MLLVKLLELSRFITYLLFSRLHDGVGFVFGTKASGNYKTALVMTFRLSHP